MTTYVQLVGGVNYSLPTTAQRMSLATGRWAWLDRRNSNGLRRCPSLEGPVGTTAGWLATYFPNWGDPGWVDPNGYWYGGFAYFLREDHGPTINVTDMHPDRVLLIGPRGGATWRSA